MNKTSCRFLLLPLACGMLSSCVYYTPTVPDMPYQGTAGRTAYPDTWVTTQPAGVTIWVASSLPPIPTSRITTSQP